MIDSLAKRLQLQLPSPLQPLDHPLFDKMGVEVWVKRDDLIHPIISGNKWRKLKGILARLPDATDTLLSFGGAYSNHLYALAEVGKHSGLKTIGIVRGEPHHPLNSTLAQAQRCGMRLHYIDRKRYRQRRAPDFLQQLSDQFDAPWIIPEGGSCVEALDGVAELVREIALPFDALYLPCGSGGTTAGVASVMRDGQQCVAVPVIKGGAGLQEDIERLNPALATHFQKRWILLCDYHFGGYARSQPALLEWIAECNSRWHLPLEPVYSGKALFALMDQVKKGAHPRGSCLVFLHTGGLR